MNALEDSATMGRAPARGQRMTRGLCANGMLVAAVVAYAVGVVLFMGLPVAGVVAWGLLATVAGLVVMAFLAGVVPAVRPVKVVLRRRRDEPRDELPNEPSDDPDEWADLWEELMEKAVQ